MTDRVWVTNEKTVVHTNRKCPQIIGDARLVNRQRFPDLEECAYCSGEADRSAGAGVDPDSVRLFLEDASPEEVGL